MTGADTGLPSLDVLPGGFASFNAVLSALCNLVHEEGLLARVRSFGCMNCCALGLTVAQKAPTKPADAGREFVIAETLINLSK